MRHNRHLRIAGIALFLLLSVHLHPVLGQNLDAYEQEAGQVLQRLRNDMMAEMQKAMKIGPAAAIGICRHLAPEIAARIQKETGWELRRISLKVRNPANRANDDEQSILLAWETRALSGQPVHTFRTIRMAERDGARAVHLMQAVPMIEACLACHGKKIDPATMAEIHRLYPEDEAIGYALGEIRGAFSLYKSQSRQELEKSLAPREPPLTRIGYKPKARPGARGDAERGRITFERHCANCHAPTDLAKHVYGPEPGKQERVCRFLETHGFTGKPQDCDIVAFLEDLALFMAGK